MTGQLGWTGRYRIAIHSDNRTDTKGITPLLNLRVDGLGGFKKVQIIPNLP
jgi:hypothetical protein